MGGGWAGRPRALPGAARGCGGSAPPRGLPRVPRPNARRVDAAGCTRAPESALAGLQLRSPGASRAASCAGGRGQPLGLTGPTSGPGGGEGAGTGGARLSCSGGSRSQQRWGGGHAPRLGAEWHRQSRCFCAWGRAEKSPLLLRDFTGVENKVSELPAAACPELCNTPIPPKRDQAPGAPLQPCVPTESRALAGPCQRAVGDRPESPAQTGRYFSRPSQAKHNFPIILPGGCGRNWEGAIPGAGRAVPPAPRHH